MSSSYAKPYLSLSDQLNLLKRRGLTITDDAAAEDCLHRNGYYRLSAYWYPFREIIAGSRSNHFLVGSRFDDAIALYVFDKQFKLLLIDALECVEIAVRVEIALLLGQRDPFAHTHASSFHTQFTSQLGPSGRTRYQDWMDKFESQVTRSKDEFILHYERQYGSRTPLPIWIAIELWDFGALSHLYSGLKIHDRVAVARRFSVPDWKIMQNWLRCLNYVRNVIAHHGRLWNLNLSENPKLPKLGEMREFDVLRPLPNVTTRVYSICCILAHLSRIINSSSSWSTDLKDLVDNFPAIPHVSAQQMGFSVNWQQHPFWR